MLSISVIELKINKETKLQCCKAKVSYDSTPYLVRIKGIPWRKFRENTNVNLKLACMMEMAIRFHPGKRIILKHYIKAGSWQFLKKYILLLESCLFDAVSAN